MLRYSTIFLVIWVVFIYFCRGEIDYNVHESYDALVQSDGIVYTSLSMDEFVDEVHIRIAASHAKFSPKVLIGIDRVPTPSYYDAIFEIPPFPQMLLLTDRRIGPCTLFFGLHGGELLHRRRYFAGSPESSLVSLSSTKLYMGGLESLPQLDQAMTISLYWNATYTVSIPINERLSSWSTTIEYDCAADKSSFIRAHAVLGFEHVTASFPLECSSDRQNILTLEFPTPGRWTLELSWALTPHNRWPPSKRSLLLHQLRSSILPNSPVASLNHSAKFRMTTLSEYGSGSGSGSGSQILHITLRPSAVRCPRGWFAANGSTGCQHQLIPATLIKSLVRSDKVIFAAEHATTSSDQSTTYFLPLDANSRSQIIPGGSLVIRLVMATANSSLNDGDGDSVMLLARFCNIPLLSWASTMQLYPNSTEAAVQQVSQDDGGLRALEVTISRPRMPGIWKDGCEGLFLTVQRMPPSTSSLLWQQHISVISQFAACTDHTCKHGDCHVQHDAVTTATCQCRYPYAGETCEDLSISFAYYTAQVLKLVLSNCCATPAVLSAWKHGLYLPAATLALSASTSAVYHLCDTDLYCLYPFLPLQIADVLLSISAIFTYLLLLTPISPASHAAWSVACIAVMCSPVTSSPTNPLNVLMVVTAALLLVGYLHCAARSRSTNYPGPDYRMVTVESRTRTASKYQAIALQEQHVLSGGRGEIELGEVRERDPDSEEKEGLDGDALISTPTSGTWQAWRRVWKVAVGGIIGAAGLVTFAVQTAEDYWILHSMWHAMMMLAALLVVEGREDFLSFCGYLSPRSIGQL